MAIFVPMRFLFAAILFLALSVSAAEDGLLYDGSYYELPTKHELHEEMEQRFPAIRIPASFTYAGVQLGEGEWGNVDQDEAQGITHDENSWYYTTQWKIYKLSKSNPPEILAENHLMKIQHLLKDGFYKHFGGMSYYHGYIYVAVTGRTHPFSSERSGSIVAVFDEKLNFVKYGKFPRKIQPGAGWLAINSVNGHLYSSSPHRKLFEYTLDFENGEELKLVRSYDILYRHGGLKEEQWANVPNQGGVFTKSGLLFYVLDVKDADMNPFTGVHAFFIHDDGADELDVSGLNNRGEKTPFISIKYRGNQPGDRFWEMEDLDIIEENGQEYLLHLQLRNGKTDEAKIVRYRLNE